MRTFFFAIVLFIMAFSGGTATEWWRKEKTPVLRIGISPWPGYEYLYLADQKGFFREEGLNVQIKQFSSPEEDVRAAFERGQIEAMGNTIADMLRAYIHTSRIPQIVLVTDYSKGADMILAREPVKTVRDLKGKNIAVEPMSLGMVVLGRALEMENMTVKDVRILNFAQTEMKEALENGKVDAVITYPPISFDVQKIEGVARVFDSSQIPGEIVDILAVDARFLAENPETAPALRRAWGKAVSYARDHKEEAFSIMAEREGVSVVEFEDALKGIYIVPEQEQGEILAGGSLEKAITRTSSILFVTGATEAETGDARRFIYISAENGGP